MQTSPREQARCSNDSRIRNIWSSQGKEHKEEQSVKHIFCITVVWYFFPSKQLKVKKARWVLGQQQEITDRSCLIFWLSMVVHRKLSGTATSLGKNLDKIYFSKTAPLLHSSEGFYPYFIFASTTGKTKQHNLPSLF